MTRLATAAARRYTSATKETGAFWSPTPLPPRSSGMCAGTGLVQVFEHQEGGIASELFTYVAMDAPVKFAW